MPIGLKGRLREACVVGALGTSGEDVACIMIYSAGPSERDHSRGNIRILTLVYILCGSGSWLP